VLTDLFRKRVSSLRNRSDYFSTLKALNLEEATRFGADFLGKGGHQAAGIDGSMDFDEVLELLLFYVCASGYSAPFHVEDEGVTFDLNRATRIPGLSMSAAVPLWEEDLSNLVEVTESAESEPDLRRSRERIPFALMTMAELSMALEIVRSGRYSLLFLDRPLSGTFPALNRDASILLTRGRSSLVGLETRAGQLRFVDIYLASGLGAGGSWIPKRGVNLTYAAIKALIDNGKLRRERLGQTLHLSYSELNNLCSRLVNINRRLGWSLLEISGDLLSLKEGVSDYWARVIDASAQVVSKVFKDSKHPLVDERGRWLSVLDLNTVSLFLTYALEQEASERNILIIGVAKDTSATEYTRAVLPFLLSKKEGAVSPRPPELKSDKAFLTILSAVNPGTVPTPWRTPAYDACFTTLMWSPEDKTPLKSARKVVSREQMYIRSYFQLRSFSDDPSVRSPVFLYDRVFTPRMDEAISELKAIERGREAMLRAFIELDRTSKIDNLILYLLSLSDNREVMEAYGHNQLLYLADKYVKEEVVQMKGLLRGVVELELTPLARREKVFTVARRFRDLRAASEMARKRKTRKVGGEGRS